MKVIEEFFVMELINYFDEEIRVIRKCYLLADRKSVIVEISENSRTYYRIEGYNYLQKNSNNLRSTINEKRKNDNN